MKVFVVKYILVLDGQYTSNDTRVFSTEEKAREVFDEFVMEEKLLKEDGDWSDDDSNPNYYESWSKDGYIMNHCQIILEECELE